MIQSHRAIGAWQVSWSDCFGQEADKQFLLIFFQQEFYDVRGDEGAVQHHIRHELQFFVYTRFEDEQI